MDILWEAHLKTLPRILIYLKGLLEVEEGNTLYLKCVVRFKEGL